MLLEDNCFFSLFSKVIATVISCLLLGQAFPHRELQAIKKVIYCSATKPNSQQK